MRSKKRRPRLERRTSPRADASLSMRVEGRPEGGEPTKILTESQNISAKGVYCRSPHYLAPLSKVSVTIVLPNHAGPSGSPRLLKCEGVVVRCRAREAAPRQGYELACSFIALDSRQKLLLDDYVARRNLQAIRAGAVPPRRSGRAVRPGARPVARRAAASRRPALRARRTSRTRSAATRTGRATGR